MQIVFIRHSMTAGNLERRYIGCRTDEPLCEAGISLAQQKTAEIRQTFPMPEVVLTSPMRRCVQTAEILFPDTPREIVYGLQECDSGGTLAFPSGESRAAFLQRCCQALEQALQRQQHQTVAAVVHGGTIMAVLSALEEQQKPYFSWQAGHCEPILCTVTGTEPLRLRQQLTERS